MIFYFFGGLGDGLVKQFCVEFNFYLKRKRIFDVKSFFGTFPEFCEIQFQIVDEFSMKDSIVRSIKFFKTKGKGDFRPFNHIKCAQDAFPKASPNDFL